MVKIDKKELRELLEAYHRLQALECGGIDNWWWYGESMKNYCEEAKCDSIENIVDEEIKKYEEVEYTLM